MSRHVTIVGDKELYRKLASLGGNVGQVQKQVLQQTGRIVVANAKKLCPTADRSVSMSRSRSERAKRSIPLSSTISMRDTLDGKGIEVTSGSNTGESHAAYVEFGTGQRGIGSASPPKWDGPLSYTPDWSGMAAQPYLYPASEGQREVYPRRMEGEMKKAIAKVVK